MRRLRALMLAGGLMVAGAVAAQTTPPAPQAPASGPEPTPQPAPAAPGPILPDAPASLPVPPPEPAPEPQAEVPAAPEPKAPEEPEEPKPPMKRARYDVAILQALDKVTAETIRFEAPVGQPIRYKSLVFTVRACELSAPDEPTPDAVAYLTIDSQPKPVQGRPTPPARQVFRGWMYAASPGLNPVEHPVYDAWLITCRAASPVRGG